MDSLEKKVNILFLIDAARDKHKNDPKSLLQEIVDVVRSKNKPSYDCDLSFIEFFLSCLNFLFSLYKYMCVY